MLLGIALVFRETGQLTLGIAQTERGLWLRAGSACLLVGLGLKSAIVPLHTWLPDAYGRAPGSVSAMLAGIISKSTLVLMLKVGLGLGLPAETLGLGLLLLSFLNMTLGNGLALVQTHTKRLLAYSSIAQTGYIMFSLGIGLRYGLPQALQAGMFLLLTHAVMKATAFLSKGVCHFYNDATLTTELRGTAQRLPLPALTFGLALAGLAGIPPLAGFVSKWFILTEGLRAADGLAYVGLGIFLLNSLLALGYYLPLIVRLFTPLPDGALEGTAERVKLSPWMALPLLGLGALIIAMGLNPGPWLAWVR
jgi:formate hydrogenlyase subunit 3/multisubunit Na+/H+ antiporter MnhD subunit